MTASAVFLAASLALAVLRGKGQDERFAPLPRTAARCPWRPTPPTEAIMQYQRDIFGNYLFSGPVDELTILHVAGHIRETHFHRETAMRDPQTTREFLIAKLAHLPHEVFAVIFLDNRHRLLAFEVLFTGTLDGASVYPREVVRRVLHHNAAAVVLAHYVARNIMGVMCPVFLCGPESETWRTAMVSKRWMGT